MISAQDSTSKGSRLAVLMAIESLEAVKEKLNRKADTTRISLLFSCGFICFFLLIIYYEFRIHHP